MTENRYINGGYFSEELYKSSGLSVSFDKDAQLKMAKWIVDNKELPGCQIYMRKFVESCVDATDQEKNCFSDYYIEGLSYKKIAAARGFRYQNAEHAVKGAIYSFAVFLYFDCGISAAPDSFDKVGQNLGQTGKTGPHKTRNRP